MRDHDGRPLDAPGPGQPCPDQIEPEKRSAMACRESAITVIRSMARRRRDESHQLERLADGLERSNLTRDAEEQLWGFFISLRSR